MSEPTEVQIKELAAKILDVANCSKIDEMLSEGRLDSERRYLLGTLDAIVEEAGPTSHPELDTYYKTLGFSREEAAKVRQKTPLN